MNRIEAKKRVGGLSRPELMAKAKRSNSWASRIVRGTARLTDETRRAIAEAGGIEEHEVLAVLCALTRKAVTP